MDRTIAIFVDGLGARAASSGILSRLQGRIIGIGAFTQGRPLDPNALRNVRPLPRQHGAE
jgi:hypothetical protein